MQNHLIPLSQINEDAFPCDRSHLTSDTLATLAESIRISGLRHPIVLCGGADDSSLISGYCRFRAYKKLAQFSDAFNNIPAQLIDPGDCAYALRLMVEENAFRKDISPDNQVKIAANAYAQGCYATRREALSHLFPETAKQLSAENPRHLSIEMGPGDRSLVASKAVVI